MGLHTVTALVLRYANYRETSRMLTLFTREKGLISASAKGCLRPKSPDRAAVELFARSEFVLSERAGRYTVTATALEEAHYNLRLDMDALGTACLLRDLCLAVLPEGEPQPQLFALASQSLLTLNQGHVPGALVRIHFELQALTLLGMQPQLTQCSHCGAPSKAIARLWFSASSGGLVCGDCPPVHDARLILPGSLALLRQLGAWPAQRLHVLKPAKAVLDTTLQLWVEYVTYHLERRMRAEDFVQTLRQIPPAPPRRTGKG